MESWGSDGRIFVDPEGVDELIRDVGAFRVTLTKAEASIASMLRTTGQNATGAAETQCTRIAASLESSSQARVILVDHLTEALRLNARSFLEHDTASAQELAVLESAV